MAIKKPNPHYIILVVTGIIAVLMNLKPIEYNSQVVTRTPPVIAIKHFTFGYSETVADSMWLRAIQNFIGCEQLRGGTSMSPDGRKMGLDRTPSCSFSWLYHMLNVVMELAPRFKVVADVGPLVLSTIVDDIDGATLLFEKAIKHFPNDWVILSRAASHFALEVEDRPRASALYLRAVELGAPVWMGLYASKLLNEEGLKLVAERVLRSFLDHERLSDREREFIKQKLGSSKK